METGTTSLPQFAGSIDDGDTNWGGEEAATMATRAKTDRQDARPAESPFAHLRATPEELAQILAGVSPFDAEAWYRNASPPTPEEMADLEDFLRELEELRRYGEQTLAGRLAELGK